MALVKSCLAGAGGASSDLKFTVQGSTTTTVRFKFDADTINQYRYYKVSEIGSLLFIVDGSTQITPSAANTWLDVSALNIQNFVIIGTTTNIQPTVTFSNSNT